MKALQFLIEFLTRWAVALLAIYCALLLVGTLEPFNFTDPALITGRPHPIEWIPFSYKCPICGYGINDKILNTAMFMPFGLLLALRRIGKAPTVDALVPTTLWGVAFSLGIEITQVFLPARTPSASDVTLNTVGAFLGALLAIVITRVSQILRMRRN